MTNYISDKIQCFSINISQVSMFTKSRQATCKNIFSSSLGDLATQDQAPLASNWSSQKNCGFSLVEKAARRDGSYPTSVIRCRGPECDGGAVACLTPISLALQFTPSLLLLLTSLATSTPPHFLHFSSSFTSPISTSPSLFLLYPLLFFTQLSSSFG